MKILCLNCHPDFTWLTSKGLKLNVTNLDVQLPKFDIIEVPSNSGKFYIPDSSDYTHSINGYDVIMVGWNPKDYDYRVSGIGGYAFPNKQSNGARVISIRVDTPPVNMYPLHELLHTICNIINIDFGDHVPKDFLDMTPVNGKWYAYYKNNPDITDSDSNFNSTWREIVPFLDKLNNLNKTMTYKYFAPKEIVGLKPELVSILDKMRGECGFPFKINSGYRTVAYNNTLKDSVKDSAHTTGEAVDISITDSTKRDKFISVLKSNGIKRYGIADSFIHIDISKTLPQNVCWLY